MDIIEEFIAGWILCGFINLGLGFPDMEDNATGSFLEGIYFIFGSFVCGPFWLGLTLRFKK